MSQQITDGTVLMILMYLDIHFHPVVIVTVLSVKKDYVLMGRDGVLVAGTVWVLRGMDFFAI